MTAHFLALCGGVGGAKMALGLARLLGEDELTIAVNTGDDFEHLGLSISPDIDTVAYTLSGLADRTQASAIEGDTRIILTALDRLGGDTWFQLGDQDLAMHMERTRRLAAGETLSQITRALTLRLGVRHLVAPMSDQPVRTWLDTEIGPLEFQPDFVRERCRPVARGIRYEGAATAAASPALTAALARTDLAAILICPSNPYLSIDPILAIPGVAEAIRASGAPCVAVSPIVGGAAIKGPTAKLMWELGVTPGVRAIARHYQGLIDGLVLDEADTADAGAIEAMGIRTLVTATVMRSEADRVAVAGDAMAFATSLPPPPRTQRRAG